MSVEIKWLGHASFRIACEGVVVYIDPWKLTGEPQDADVVFVSHDHYDHCSPRDVLRVCTPDTAVVGPPGILVKLARTKCIAPGKTMRIRGIGIEAVAAYNIGKSFHPKSAGWCGAVLRLGGKRIYYAGDTDLIPEMEALGDVDVALLPVGGTYTLDAAEAARACEAIGCKAAIPCHWGDIVGTRADADDFAAAATCEVHVLEPGESITI